MGGVTRLPPIPGLDRAAIPFKTVEEAIALRNHVLSRLDLAETTHDSQVRRRALTFVVGGGGFTGVEVLGELEDMAGSLMMYGHVDNPAHWVTHLRALSPFQDTTGGFIENVPLPSVHHPAPIYLAGVARPGPTVRVNLAVHAMARIMLHGRIEPPRSFRRPGLVAQPVGVSSFLAA